MSSLITSAIIGKETLLNFQNSLVVGSKADWQYSAMFGKEESQIGNSRSIRRPIAVTLQENNMSWNAANSAVTETYVKLVVDRSLTVPMSFTEGDMALKIERFSERYIGPTVRQIAAVLDARVCDSISNSTVATASATSGLSTAGLDGNAVGTPNAAGYVVGAFGSSLTPATIMKAKQYLIDVACPDDGRIYGFLSSKAQSDLNQAQATLFNPLLQVDSVYRAGEIGQYAGIKFSATQSAATHTNGTQTDIAVTSGTLTSGWAESATLVIDASAGINTGDMFEAPTQVLVNPLSKFPTSTKAQFQVISVTDGTHVVVSPAPISAGPYKNISATIDGATLTLVGASGASGQESLIFHKSAVACASPALSVPSKGVEMARLIQDEDIDGFVLRFLRTYDALGASTAFGGGVGTGGPGFVNRYDTIWGVKTTNVQWIVRVRA